MIAAYRLKGIGWFAGCTAIVLGFYLVSAQVASERKKLEHLDADIASTRRDIRALETEFDTRSNLAQLERWNGDTLALSAPAPGQFLHDATELASADVVHGAGEPGVRTAALIVPSFAAPVAIASAGEVPAPVTSAPAATRAESRRTPVRRVEVKLALGRPGVVRASYDPDAEPAPRSAGIARARPQVAMLDRKLLSDSTLRELFGGARVEGGKLR